MSVKREVVIYHRCAKTASTTLVNLVEQLSRLNGFYILELQQLLHDTELWRHTPALAVTKDRCGLVSVNCVCSICLLHAERQSCQQLHYCVIGVLVIGMGMYHTLVPPGKFQSTFRRRSCSYRQEQGPCLTVAYLHYTQMNNL